MESWTAHSEGKTTCTGGKGTQGLNTQGRVRQLETGETHQGGEVVTHLRDKLERTCGIIYDQTFKVKEETPNYPNRVTLNTTGP